MSITTAVYTTRETVQRALDQGEVIRNNRNIDRCIESAARRVDGLMHRIFYPRIDTKYFNWPNELQSAASWRVWLDDAELISATTISSGGATIAGSDYLLEPNRTGPPYSRLEVNLGTSASFGGGSTHQRDITVTGLWGYTDDHITVGALTEALDSSETGMDVSPEASAELGIGSILKVGTERMIVTERRQIDTGQDVGGTGLTNNKNSVSVTVADGTQFAPYEVILVESERMLITDIAGNTLTVERAFEGTTIAAHAAGVDIYAPRTLTVTRGALGSTAAAHSSGDTVTAWKVPPGIRQLNTAEAIHELLQEQTGWFRTMSASSVFGGTSKRSASTEALMDFREQIYREYGRKARTRTI